MIPVDQTIFASDEPGAARGNCFQAAVASVLNLPLDEVPHFCDGARGWERRFDAWLAERGLGQVEVKLDADAVYPVPGGMVCIVVGKTKRHASRLHAVVAKTIPGGFMWDYLHDPHPDRTFLTAAHSVQFLVPLDVTEWMQKPQ